MSENRLIVVRRPAIEAGACNFCTRLVGSLFEIGGANRALRIRMCDSCLRELKQQSKPTPPEREEVP